MEEMVCTEFVERVTDYLEDVLNPADLARVEAHLSDCSFCNLYLQQMRMTRGVSTLIINDESRLNLDQSALLEAYRKWIADRDDP